MPKKKRTSKRQITEEQLVLLGGIFPGFAEWYRSNYDENGDLLPVAQRPAIPGLRPPYLREGQEEDNPPLQG